tara:strand:+ start:145 stop:810 length:666 start_codon:yes stop_codon:yes gene_type:complete
MIEHVYTVCLIVLSYLSGSTPTSLIVGKLLRNIDIRDHGSGNAGGTNVFRLLGWRPALIVVFVDMLKGWFPCVILARYFFDVQFIPDLGVLQIFCGCSAVLGHTYTVFGGFKGGKGVSTLGGMMLALFPTVFPFCLGIAIITIILTGYVSLASIMASCSLPILLILIPPFLGLDPAPLSIMIFSLLVPWFIIFTHRSNVQRLRDGSENQFKNAMLFKKGKV